ITVTWILGHDGVEGKESGDKQAKLAAKNPRNNSPAQRLPLFLCKGILPSSVSALKQAQKDQLKTRWTLTWKQSPRF
ncbi:hypothetical protein BDN67DRAFT_866062, partial [Paxillus ammoniavirescens]